MTTKTKTTWMTIMIMMKMAKTLASTTTENAVEQISRTHIESVLGFCAGES